ncbi:MAG: type IV secretory system conjugative DNA transfer family protein [Pseudomonadota bacterium]
MSERYVDLGNKLVWGGTRPLALSSADRRRHLYIVGQTGVGKSTLLKHIICQDIENNAGLAMLDPHGDLAEELLDLIPSHRVDDVIYLDPTDIDRPMAFNPFYRVPKDERALVAANQVGIFKAQFGDSWGPRLEYILLNVFRALLDAPDHLRPTYLSVPRVLVDKKYRTQVIKYTEDLRARSFFVDELSTWPERQLAEALSPIQNKVGQFLSNPFIRNVVCQWKPSFDLFHVMEEEKILIIRVPKGFLGEEPANLFGSFLISGLQQAAMRRAGQPEESRKDFHMVIDEFPNFTTDTFSNTLSEARKYGLTLTVGHQYIAQMSHEIEKAIFGNVGSIVSFRVSAEDADRLAREIGEYAPAQLRDLERGQVFARILENGEPSNPCLAKTNPDALRAYKNKNTIIEQSRARYGRDRQDVESGMARWLASMPGNS